MKKTLARAAQLEFAAQLDLVLSAAQLNKKQKNGKIAMVFVDGSAVKLACWHQAIHAAGVQRLPILFVCQSKLVKGQAKVAEAKIPLEAEANGLPGVIVDGNDVVAVYRVATESIAHARKGSGATLIQCMIDYAKAHDPILKMEAYLKRKGLFSERLRLKADKILRG
jgi:TPP-dependent pyruvate/acetoin dehydrogenase alpha subunit